MKVIDGASVHLAGDNGCSSIAVGHADAELLAIACDKRLHIITGYIRLTFYCEVHIDIEFSVVQTEKVQTLGKIVLTATIGDLSMDTDSTQSVEASATGTWTTARNLSSYEDAVTVTAATAGVQPAKA